jgi:hypothetical protein
MSTSICCAISPNLRRSTLAEAEAERLAQLEGAREALAALKRARPLAMPPEIREQLAGAGR